LRWNLLAQWCGIALGCLKITLRGEGVGVVWKMSGRAPFRLACDGAHAALAGRGIPRRVHAHANDAIYEDREASRNWTVLLVLLVPPAATLTALAAIW